MVREPATPDDVREILGEVDDLMIERILETDATADEIAEAARSVEADDLVDREVDFVATSPRVTEVRSLLTELAAGEEDEYLLPYDDEVHQTH
jgi:hypothetical protein